MVLWFIFLYTFPVEILRCFPQPVQEMQEYYLNQATATSLHVRSN
jgi:hypothetical protein